MMRQNMLLIMGLLVMALVVPYAAQAQNYVAPDNYSGPNVMVNLDVLASPQNNARPPRDFTPPQRRQPVQMSNTQPVYHPSRPPAPSAQMPPLTMPAPHAMLAQARAEAAADERKPTRAAADTERAPVDFQDMPAPAPKTNSVTVPVARADDFQAYRVLYQDTAPELDEANSAILRGVIAKLKQNAAIRVQILAYAASTPDTLSVARRLSLTRALGLRTAILAAGIAPDRIDVKAMGGDVTVVADKSLPPHRADLIFVK